MRKAFRVLTAGAAALFASQASATWSILLVDLSTGEIAVGSATCLTGFDLQANTPVLIPGVGAITAQSFVDANGINRSLIRDRLHEGVPPELILDELAVFDGGHETRQYGMVNAMGNAATFTGTGAGQWAGGRTGVLSGAGITGGDVLYAIQGNVLWGPGVVDDAVGAVRDAPGDLPDKLLAGMQAARDAGGDGRCSCLPNDADACIDDVPMGQKSSDIAYMLVARAGDREGCAPIHRLGSSPLDIEPLDDERFVVSFRQGGDTLSIIRPGRIASPPTLGDVQSLGPGVDVDEIATGDVTGDGLADIVGCSPLNDGTWLIEADPSEPSGFRAPVQLLDTGHDVAIADLDTDGRRDIVVADSVGDAVIVVWNTGAGFIADAPIEIGETPDMVAIADVNGDGLQEVAAVCRGDSSAWVLRQQPGRVFEARDPIPLGVPFPSVVELADIDSDGSVELLAAGLGSATLQVIDPAAGVSETLLPMPSNVRDLSVIDLGSGPRAFVLGVTGSVVLQPLFPGGPLLYGEELALFQQPVRALPRDLDGDGDADLAVLAQVGRSVRFIDNVAGGFPLTRGCGDGDFFMEFNIAFSNRQDPDPVDQLEGLFAAWSADLQGVPDAVRSSALLDAPFASSVAGCPTTLRVELRDRDGLPASAAGLTVEPLAADAPLGVGSIAQVAPGRFEVTLLGRGDRGEARFTLTAELDGREVRLMPTLRVAADDPADLDGDGDRDADDLNAWVAAFRAGDSRADQNFDGVVTASDFNAWVLNRNRACN
ncbi:MAG: DUF1028 domain-containing protein [Planctomycetota bacterium]